MNPGSRDAERNRPTRFSVQNSLLLDNISTPQVPLKPTPNSVTPRTFPDFTLVSASAGSGKTHALTQRYLEFILSKGIPENRLRNILAITFTNNAAREMKQRILGELKQISTGNGEILGQLQEALGEDEKAVRSKASEMVDYILDDYSEFQVQTIDSFLSRVFRASALEFGFPPDVEILIDSSPLLTKSFERFAQELALDPSRRSVLDELVELLLASQPANSKYLWNPFAKLSGEVRNLYNKLIQRKENLAVPDQLIQRKQHLQKDILRLYRDLLALVKKSKCEMVRNFETLNEIADRNDVDALIGRQSLFNSPIKKSGLPGKEYERWNAQFAPLQERLRKTANEYILVGVHTYYHAYAEALRYFQGVINGIMKEEARVAIGDVNRFLATTINQEIVPEIYYYLGERIHHYLIDEFQDTSPLQWDVFRPLAEEALATKGSLYVVGDTKQSIYTFRGADWQIMHRLMEKVEVFPSAPVNLDDLKINYRSFQRIVDFNKEVFQKVVPSVVPGNASRLSGLSDYVQGVKPEFRGKGYVEVFPVEEDSEGSVRQAKILDVLKGCKARGYSYNEITILTPKNSDVVEISEWLNREQIPFISHSNLDIRGRKVTGELLAILRFLESPVDDLALMTFVLGNIFKAQLGQSVEVKDLHQFIFGARRGAKRQGTLYRAFQKRFPELWQTYFEGLFNRVGYLPLYDLVAQMYTSFDLFGILPGEEATFVKFLEVIKDFERDGRNSLKDFLLYTEEENEDSDWNIPVPLKTDAVSVMTIHKAKGLGNRVVVVLLEDSNPPHDNLFIQEDEKGLHLLHITKDSAGVNAHLGQLYAEGQLRRAVDDLNKLYVAFTRAKEELYVVSVKGKRGEPSKFLPQTGYEPGPKPRIESQPVAEERTIEATHIVGEAALQPVSSEAISLYERKRGEFIHAILAKLEFVGDDIPRQIRQAAEEVEFESREQLQISTVEKLLVGFLQNAGVREFFSAKENRRVLNEQEFAQSDGRLFRMDRIILDTDRVTVVDYKTGGEDPEYTVQVRGYLNILKDVYPQHSMRGFLAYVDRNVVREVVAEQK